MKIRISDRIVFETFQHYVYEMDLHDQSFEENELKAVLINKENLEEAGSAVGNTTRKWILNDYEYARGYYFLNEDDVQVGSCWIMLKGGDEKLYKVRKHDSFIFRVQIGESFRGKGYAKKMMYIIFNILKDLGCNNTCLVCAAKNSVANNLYQSLGMRREGNRLFVRLFDHNMPYLVL